MKKILNLIKTNFFFILILLIFSHVSNLYYNMYSTYIRGYEERMVRAYGDCERESFGFVKKSYDLIKSHNLNVVNAERLLWPNINSLFNEVGADGSETNNVDEKYTVILNLKKINKDKIIYLDNKKYNLNNKNIILKESNCYLLKND